MNTGDTPRTDAKVEGVIYVVGCKNDAGAFSTDDDQLAKDHLQLLLEECPEERPFTITRYAPLTRAEKAEADLARLTEERELAKDSFRKALETCSVIEKQRNEAQEENEALRKDAERYRWLRECSPFRSDRSVRVVQENYVNGVFKGENFLHVESLDAAIDAAIKEGS